MLFSSKPSRGLSGLSWLSGGILQANGTFRCSHDAVEFMSQGSYTALTASQLLAPAELRIAAATSASVNDTEYLVIAATTVKRLDTSVSLERSHHVLLYNTFTHSTSVLTSFSTHGNISSLMVSGLVDAGSDAEDSTPHLLLVLGFDINKICILPLNAAKALIAPVVDKPATLYTFAGGGQVTCISSFRVPATPYTRLFIGTSIGTLGMCTFSIKDDEVSWQTWTVMKNKTPITQIAFDWTRLSSNEEALLAVAQSCLDNDPRHRSDISHITVLAASSSEFSFVDSSEPSIQVEGVLSRLECRQENAGSFVVLATTLVESQLSNTLLELRLEPKPDGDGEDRNLAVVSTSQIPCATRILDMKFNKSVSKFTFLSLGKCLSLTRNRDMVLEWGPYTIPSFEYWLGRVPNKPLYQKNCDVAYELRRNGNMLFIDRMLHVVEPKLIDIYPPKDSTMMERVYNEIWMTQDDQLRKQCFTLYFLKDLGAGKEIEFCKHYLVPSHIQHLIFGYWSLDHGFYEDAVKHLTANTVDTEWSANIVATLAAKQQYNQAIKYINVVDPVVGNVEECRVRLKILVHSVVPHAFMFQRKYADLYRSECDMFTNFLEQCFQGSVLTSETLHILLSLPFTSVEENRLIEFCKVNYSIPLYANFLVLYYVNHCRYIEAIKFYNELMELPSALATKNKLGAMVDNLRLLLPEVQKNALLVHLGKRGRMIQRPLYPRVLEAQHTTQKQPQPQKQAQTQAQPQQPIANAVTSLQPQGLDVEMHSAQTSASVSPQRLQQQSTSSPSPLTSNLDPTIALSSLSQKVVLEALMDNMPRKEEQSQQQLPLTTNVLSTTSNDVLPLSDDMMLDVEMETDTVVATAASPIPVATAVINLTPAEISQPQSHQQPLFKNNIGDIDAPFIKPPHTPIDRRVSLSPKKISNNNIKPSSSNSSSAVASPSMSSQKENILAEKKDALQYVSPMNKSSINSSPIIVNNSNTSNTRQAPPLKNMSPFSPRKRREAVSSTPGQSSGSIQKPSPMSMKLDLKLIQPSSVLPSPSRQQQQQSGEEVGGRDDTAMEEEASAPSSKLVDKYEANNAEVVIGGGDDSTKTASTKKRSTRSQTPQSAAIVTTEKREFRRTPARLNRLNEAGVSVQHTPSKLSNLVASSTTVTTRSGRKNVVEGGETVAPIGKTASTRTPRSRNSSTNSNMDEVVSSSSASSTPHSSRRGGKLSSSRGKLLDEQQTSLSSTPKSVVRRSVSQSIATSKSTTRAQKE